MAPRTATVALAPAAEKVKAAGMVGLPTGVVSFVLTDVVGSTELWERAPEAMAAALARHDEIVRAAVDATGGTVLKARGEGDSTFSVFARATDAVRAADRLQRALRDERWDPEAVLHVRVAVHTGEAVERDGDFLGPAVNRVARLRGEALPGEVLVSGATAALVRGSLPESCSLVELGAFALRGIDQPEPAFALAGPGLAVRDRSPASSAPPGVSRREADVLALVAEHLTNAEIAHRLVVSERTVESHVSSLLRKLGATDRRQLATLAVPAEAAPRPAPSRLPAALELLADPTGYVGREAERSELRRLWQLARDGRTICALVTGEAGIGKSRLVAELAAEVDAEGGHVLLGASQEDVDAAYGPFVQAIEADAATLDDAGRRRRVAVGGEALGRLSPALGHLLGGTAKPGSVPPDRTAAADAVRAWLTASAAAAPLLLVVEDAHWSTATTRDALRHLVRSGDRDPLLIVVTTRDTTPDLDDDLRRLLGDLTRLPNVTRVPLRGLERDEVARLVSGDDVEAILAETGGNPLLVTHVAGEHGLAGASLDALLARRDELLDDTARAALDLAATLGAEFDASTVAAGLGDTDLRVLVALEAAEQAGLVVALPGRPGRFAFVHALFRSNRYQAMAAGRRRAMHARAADALAGREDALSERARHACLAAPSGDPALAIDLATRAGDQADRACARDEAAVHYRRALDLAAPASLDPAAMLALRIRLGAALHHAADPAGLPMLLDAADQARRDGDCPALVAAAISIPQSGAILLLPGEHQRFLAICRDALAHLGDAPSAERAILLGNLAGHLLFQEGIDEAVQHATEAEALARELDDPDVLGQVLLAVRHIGQSHPSREDWTDRIQPELEILGRRTKRVELIVAGVNGRAGSALRRGDLVRWAELLERSAEELGDRNLPFFRLGAKNFRVQQAFLRGDLDGAAELARALAPDALAIGHAPANWTGSTMLLVLRLRGRDGDQVAPLERAAGQPGDRWLARCALAASYARIGAVDAAVRALDGLRADSFRIPAAYGWSVSMSELAEAAEVVGDAETARHVLSELRPYAGWIGESGPAIGRPVNQALAQAALACPDGAEEAERHARASVEDSRRWNAPVWLVRDLSFLAEARRRNGAPRGEVRPLVEECSALARDMGVQAAFDDLARYGLA
jgi:class 3 adenylate cyclase